MAKTQSTQGRHPSGLIGCCSFFMNNLSLSGFTNEDMLLMTAKEMIDNAVDACRRVNVENNSHHCKDVNRDNQNTRETSLGPLKVSLSIEPVNEAHQEELDKTSFLVPLVVSVRDSGEGLKAHTVECLGHMFSSSKLETGVACGRDGLPSNESEKGYQAGKFGLGLKFVLLASAAKSIGPYRPYEEGLKITMRVSETEVWKLRLAFHTEDVLGSDCEGLGNGTGDKINILSFEKLSVATAEWPWMTEMSINVNFEDYTDERIEAYMSLQSLWNPDIQMELKLTTANLNQEVKNWNVLSDNPIQSQHNHNLPVSINTERKSVKRSIALAAHQPQVEADTKRQAARHSYERNLLGVFGLNDKVMSSGDISIGGLGKSVKVTVKAVIDVVQPHEQISGKHKRLLKTKRQYKCETEGATTGGGKRMRTVHGVSGIDDVLENGGAPDCVVAGGEADTELDILEEESDLNRESDEDESDDIIAKEENLTDANTDQRLTEIQLYRSSNGMPMLPSSSLSCILTQSIRDILELEGGMFGMQLIRVDVPRGAFGTSAKAQNEAVCVDISRLATIFVTHACSRSTWSKMILCINVECTQAEYGSLSKSCLKGPLGVSHIFKQALHKSIVRLKKLDPKQFESLADFKFQQAYYQYCPVMARSLANVIVRSENTDFVDASLSIVNGVLSDTPTCHNEGHEADGLTASPGSLTVKSDVDEIAKLILKRIRHRITLEWKRKRKADANRLQRQLKSLEKVATKTEDTLFEEEGTPAADKELKQTKNYSGDCEGEEVIQEAEMESKGFGLSSEESKEEDSPASSSYSGHTNDVNTNIQHCNESPPYAQTDDSSNEANTGSSNEENTGSSNEANTSNSGGRSHNGDSSETESDADEDFEVNDQFWGKREND